MGLDSQFSATYYGPLDAAEMSDDNKNNNDDDDDEEIKKKKKKQKKKAKKENNNPPANQVHMNENIGNETGGFFDILPENVKLAAKDENKEEKDEMFQILEKLNKYKQFSAQQNANPPSNSKESEPKSRKSSGSNLITSAQQEKKDSPSNSRQISPKKQGKEQKSSQSSPANSEASSKQSSPRNQEPTQSSQQPQRTPSFTTKNSKSQSNDNNSNTVTPGEPNAEEKPKRTPAFLPKKSSIQLNEPPVQQSQPPVQQQSQAENVPRIPSFSMKSQANSIPAAQPQQVQPVNLEEKPKRTPAFLPKKSSMQMNEPPVQQSQPVVQQQSQPENVPRIPTFSMKSQPNSIPAAQNQQVQPVNLEEKPKRTPAFLPKKSSNQMNEQPDQQQPLNLPRTPTFGVKSQQNSIPVTVTAATPTTVPNFNVSGRNPFSDHQQSIASTTPPSRQPPLSISAQHSKNLSPVSPTSPVTDDTEDDDEASEDIQSKKAMNVKRRLSEQTWEKNGEEKDSDSTSSEEEEEYETASDDGGNSKKPQPAKRVPSFKAKVGSFNNNSNSFKFPHQNNMNMNNMDNNDGSMRSPNSPPPKIDTGVAPKQKANLIANAQNFQQTPQQNLSFQELLQKFETILSAQKPSTQAKQPVVAESPVDPHEKTPKTPKGSYSFEKSKERYENALLTAPPNSRVINWNEWAFNIAWCQDFPEQKQYPFVSEIDGKRYDFHTFFLATEMLEKIIENIVISPLTEQEKSKDMKSLEDILYNVTMLEKEGINEFLKKIEDIGGVLALIEERDKLIDSAKKKLQQEKEGTLENNQSTPGSTKVSFAIPQHTPDFSSNPITSPDSASSVINQSYEDEEDDNDSDNSENSSVSNPNSTSQSNLNNMKSGYINNNNENNNNNGNNEYDHQKKKNNKKRYKKNRNASCSAPANPKKKKKQQLQQQLLQKQQNGKRKGKNFEDSEKNPITPGSNGGNTPPSKKQQNPFDILEPKNPSIPAITFSAVKTKIAKAISREVSKVKISLDFFQIKKNSVKNIKGLYEKVGRAPDGSFVERPTKDLSLYCIDVYKYLHETFETVCLGSQTFNDFSNVASSGIAQHLQKDNPDNFSDPNNDFDLQKGFTTELQNIITRYFTENFSEKYVNEISRTLAIPLTNMLKKKFELNEKKTVAKNRILMLQQSIANYDCELSLLEKEELSTGEIKRQLENGIPPNEMEDSLLQKLTQCLSYPGQCTVTALKSDLDKCSKAKSSQLSWCHSWVKKFFIQEKELLLRLRNEISAMSYASNYAFQNYPNYNNAWPYNQMMQVNTQNPQNIMVNRSFMESSFARIDSVVQKKEVFGMFSPIQVGELKPILEELEKIRIDFTKNFKAPQFYYPLSQNQMQNNGGFMQNSQNFVQTPQQVYGQIPQNFAQNPQNPQNLMQSPQNYMQNQQSNYTPNQQNMGNFGKGNQNSGSSRDKSGSKGRKRRDSKDSKRHNFPNPDDDND